METNDATEQLQSVVSNIGSRLSDVESMVAGFQSNMNDMNKNIANLFKVVYGAKCLVFVSSRSLKTRELSFAQFGNFLRLFEESVFIFQFCLIFNF
jgi:hypothetical protein